MLRWIRPIALEPQSYMSEKWETRIIPLVDHREEARGTSKGVHRALSNAVVDSWVVLQRSAICVRKVFEPCQTKETTWNIYEELTSVKSNRGCSCSNHILNSRLTFPSISLVRDTRRVHVVPVRYCQRMQVHAVTFWVADFAQFKVPTAIYH